MHEIVETIDGEWMILCNGFQIGGNLDASGAGDKTYPTEGEALSALADTDKED